MIVTKGSINQSVTIRIVDSADGTPETGVVWNTAGIDMQYRREGEASTAITEATLASLTTAHTDGGFLHIGNGYYRLDVPDAAFASGADGVLIHGTVTGMVVIGVYVQLADVDIFDSVRGGMAALPNAAAGAAGGLPTDSTGKTSFNDIAATAIVSGGAITTSGGAVSTVTTTTTATNLTNLPTIPANWITAAGIAASAMDGKGDWNVGKTGYSLTQTFPTNFADLAISVTTGQVTVGTNNDKTGYTASTVSDKTGYSLSASQTFDITGNLSGSVGSLGAQAKLDVNAEADTAISDAALATAAALTTVDTVVDAIKVKTDSLTFTKANEVDANVQSINGATVVGDGNATPWDGI